MIWRNIKRKVADFLRGPAYSGVWEIVGVRIIGHADRDLIGYHWTLSAYGWKAQKVVIAQGRTFTLTQAKAAIFIHAKVQRWILERSSTPPTAADVEINIRREICDFFKVP